VDECGVGGGGAVATGDEECRIGRELAGMRDDPAGWHIYRDDELMTQRLGRGGMEIPPILAGAWWSVDGARCDRRDEDTLNEVTLIFWREQKIRPERPWFFYSQRRKLRENSNTIRFLFLFLVRMISDT